MGAELVARRQVAIESLEASTGDCGTFPESRACLPISIDEIGTSPETKTRDDGRGTSRSRA